MSPEMWLIAACGFTVGFFLGGFMGVWMMCIFKDSSDRDDQARGL